MIAIIMSTYNGESFLKEQIDSILGQDVSERKLFIFDDGSEDDTCHIISEYCKEKEGSIVFKKNEINLGAKRSFLNGLKEAADFASDAHYFAFADQDDVWDSDKLSVSLKRLREIEEGGRLPAAVFSDVRLTDEKLHVTASSYFKEGRLNPEALDFSSLLMENKAIGGTLMVNRALAECYFEAEKKVGRPASEIRMHDWWLVLIAAAFGRTSFIDRATESYRQHGKNVIGGETFASYFGRRIAGIREIRKRIEANFLQGEEFELFFGDRLSAEKRSVLSDFLAIGRAGFFKRRKLLLTRGYLKSGVTRNLALMIFI